MTNSWNSPDHFILQIGDADGNSGQTALRQVNVLQVCKEWKALHSLSIQIRVPMQKLATLQVCAMGIEDHGLDSALAQRQHLPDGVQHIKVPSQRRLDTTKVVLDWHGANAQWQLLPSTWVPHNGLQNCGCLAHLQMPHQSSLDAEPTKTQ